eukprot:Gb_13939 [translate_table: standard]
MLHFVSGDWSMHPPYKSWVYHISRCSIEVCVPSCSSLSSSFSSLLVPHCFLRIPGEKVILSKNLKLGGCWNLEAWVWLDSLTYFLMHTAFNQASFGVHILFKSPTIDHYGDLPRVLAHSKTYLTEEIQTHMGIIRGAGFRESPKGANDASTFQRKLAVECIFCSACIRFVECCPQEGLTGAPLSFSFCLLDCAEKLWIGLENFVFDWLINADRKENQKIVK